VKSRLCEVLGVNPFTRQVNNHACVFSLEGLGCALTVEMLDLAHNVLLAVRLRELLLY